MFGPNYYAFSYADALFLMLDDVDYLGADRSKPRLGGKYEGRLDETQLEFVRNVLARTPQDKLIVTVMHIPMRNYLDAGADTNLHEPKELLALFEGRRFTVSFSGHTHTTEHHYFDAADGWNGASPHHHHVLTAVSGSWWSGPYDHRGVACADSRDGSPNGFHILSIDGTSYKTRFVPAKEPNGRQMRLSIDSRFHADRHGSATRVPPRAIAGLADRARRARRDLARRQCVRRRPEDQSHDDGSAIARRVAMTRKAMRRPVRRGGFRAQRGDEETVGQGGAVVARLGRAPSRRPAGREPIAWLSTR